MNDTVPGQTELDYSIVSPKLTIEAMRDSGYKSTDHALAELIDNSVDAGADLIEVVAVEQPRDPRQPYSRARLLEMAVVDNGVGMDFVTLRRALRFGDGTRLDRATRGIGRFGVGLPQSSVSQCRRVDIWTWQNGAANALHCYLDLDEIRAGGVRDVPEPTAQPVPEDWMEIAENASEVTGTLVVWSCLDRARWSGGWKTLARTGDLCGRVYRKFLHDEDPVVIRLKLAAVEDDMLNLVREEDCLPNDPLYLMTPSATPKPFADKPMFEFFNKRKWSLPVEDEDGEVEMGEVTVRCTLARREAINERGGEVKWPKSYLKAGDAPWGKHANRNKGVSIVREGRELELSLAWVNNHEPQERWWSVEVEFDSLLDEIFGVVNNKQHAHAFVSGAGFDWKDAAEEDETSFGAFKERLEETGDERACLVEIWDWIKEQIDRMRKERKNIMKGTGTPRHPQTGSEIEDVATNVINAESEQGEKGDSDRAPKATDQEKIQQIVEHRPNRVDAGTAREWAEETVGNHRRVLTKSVSLGHGNPAFFEVESVADVIEIWLNDRHPVHQRLIEVVDAASEGQTPEQLGRRLQEAAFTLRMLLIAWARLEDKTPSGQKESVREVRADWGRETRKFLSVIES